MSGAAGGERSFPRAVFLFDGAVCALFALPWLSDIVLELIGLLNLELGLYGHYAPVLGAGAFFVNFAGLVGVLLNYVLFHSRDPKAHWANIYARGGVILLILWHCAVSDMPWVFLAFVLTELGGGLLTARWLRSQQ